MIYFGVFWFFLNLVIESAIIPLELAGEGYKKIGRLEEADIVFDHLLDLYPGHPLWQMYEDEVTLVNANKAEEQNS